MTYRLHYAPDNASMIVRLTLEHGRIPYDTMLVDRRAQAQKSPAYRALNPHGLIPVLETPDGVLFETAAILLWLVDTHKGLGPQPGDPQRADFLKWLFSLSNTLHPALRMLFYPDVYVDLSGAQKALQEGARRNITAYLDRIEQLLQSAPTWLDQPKPCVADFYLATMLRWMALYPADGPRWFRLSRWTALEAFAQRRDHDRAALRVAEAEGLGAAPFSQPTYPTPPEGSAL